MDPLWEKYTGWTGYQYSLNNPVNASDGNGKFVKVFTERIPSGTLSKGSGNPFLGFIANLFSPRHTFMQIQTDKVNVIIEMGGPKGDSKKGNLIITEVNGDGLQTGGRVWVKEHKVTEPDEKNEFEFENKILNTFYQLKDNSSVLPDYDGPEGPNSNGFIEFLIKYNGGKLESINGTYGQHNTIPYLKTMQNLKID